MALILAGCGGGAANNNRVALGSGGSTNTATTSSTATNGSIAVSTTIAGSKTVGKVVPATTKSLRVSILQNGVLVVATGLTNPSTFPVLASGTTQTNTIPNVPPGSYTVITEAIDGGGTVVGVNLGTASVPAGNTANVIVKDVQGVNSIAVSPSSPTVAVGGTQNETATATLTDNSTLDVTALGTWSASPSSTATVSNEAGSQGRVTGVAAGSATVTCTYAGTSGTATITVSGTSPTPASSPTPSPGTSPSPSPGTSPSPAPSASPSPSASPTTSPSPAPSPSPNTINITNTNLDNWSQSLSGLNLNDYAFNGTNTAVVVGNNGFLATLDNSNKMTIRKSGVSILDNLNAVAWLGGNVNKFVAVGSSGIIISSPDGITWTRATGANNPVPTASELKDVCAYTNGTASGFVAVGTSDGTQGWIVESGNGTTWNDISMPGNNANYLSVAVGTTVGTWAEVISNSQTKCLANLLDPNQPVRSMWATIGTTHPNMRAVTYARSSTSGFGFFMTSGDQGWVDINQNGNRWDAASTPQITGAPNILGLAYLKAGNTTDTISLIGNNAALTASVNFVDNTYTAGNTNHTYTAGTAKFTPAGPNYQGQLTRVRAGNGKFNIAADRNALLTATDGQSYTVATYTSSSQVNGVAAGTVGGNRLFVAVGASDPFNPFGANRALIETSPDGVTWTVRDSGGVLNDLYAVAFGNGRFAAITSDGTVLISTDGVTWSGPSNNGLKNSTYRGITFGFVNGVGKFVATGNSKIGIGDANGDNWTETTKGQPFSRGIAYGRVGSPAVDMFVECAQQGKISWSTDLVTWTNVTTSQASDLFAITFNSNTFVTVGGGGRVQTSTDGKAFTDRGTFGARQLNGVTGITTPNGNANFVGYIAVGDGGTTLTSTDGITWTAAGSQTFTTENLQAVCVSSTSTSVVNNGITTNTFTNIFVGGGFHNSVITDQ